MERETTEVKIEGHVFIVKTYATALEHNAIRQALMRDVKLDVVGEQPKVQDFSLSALFEMHKELVRQLVISMDGTAENIIDRCLELPSTTFDALVSELDTLVAKKKKSTTP